MWNRGATSAADWMDHVYSVLGSSDGKFFLAGSYRSPEETRHIRFVLRDDQGSAILARDYRDLSVDDGPSDAIWGPGVVFICGTLHREARMDPDTFLLAIDRTGSVSHEWLFDAAHQFDSGRAVAIYKDAAILASQVERKDGRNIEVFKLQ